MVNKTANMPQLPDIQGTAHLTEEEVRMRLGTYLAELKASGPTPVPSQNIIGFFELVKNAIRSREASENVPSGKGLLVLADDPPEEVDTEAITYYIASREPGQWNKGPAGASKVKEVRHHLRSEQRHPEHIGEKLVTMGRFYDNVVSFNIYARNDYTALQRVLWFENVMDSFDWYFKLYNLRTIVEFGVGKREEVTIKQLPLKKYPISYLVRTENIYQIGTQELKTLVLNTNVSTNIEEG